MSVNVLMPALSPTMTEGTIAKWTKKEGDSVKAGDVIAEIETDKATMEVEAVDEGRIGKILIAAGTAGVAVNTPIAVILEDGEDFATLNLSAAKEIKSAAPVKENASIVTLSQNEKVVMQTSVSKSGSRVFATPLARRMAAQMGVDLSKLQGSGPHGRIVRADLDKGGVKVVAAPAQTSAPRAPSAGIDAKKQADLLGMTYKELPNNNIRKVVASRLLESKQTIPHFYLTVECRLDDLMAARERINAESKGAFKLSVNDFVVKACAMALKAYPAANVSWTDEAILQFDHADISVAVSTPNGLITPIVKAAETKGLRQISEEIKDMAGRAREGKLKPVEFQGGTFSVSNLGMFGVSE
ncbi:MAG: 2-oxo acid dehydrogenase subunit E2, partial [Alphaproteobacteria bacterium]|nr:2-oxo acid dehydrogenase subunit E2 [Alphaproteobacteria bacterium]